MYRALQVFALIVVAFVSLFVLTVGCTSVRLSDDEIMRRYLYADGDRYADDIERILSTPGDYVCTDDNGDQVRVVRGISIDEALTRYCDPDVCGGMSWVCR